MSDPFIKFMADPRCDWKCPICGTPCAKVPNHKSPHFCDYHSVTPFKLWHEYGAITTEELALRLKLKDKDDKTKQFYLSLFFNRPVKL